MASITITTTAPQDARLGPAFGALLGLPGNANVAQVKAELHRYMRSVVQAYEREQQVAQIADTPFDPT